MDAVERFKRRAERAGAELAPEELDRITTIDGQAVMNLFRGEILFSFFSDLADLTRIAEVPWYDESIDRLVQERTIVGLDIDAFDDMDAESVFAAHVGGLVDHWHSYSFSTDPGEAEGFAGDTFRYDRDRLGERGLEPIRVDLAVPLTEIGFAGGGEPDHDRWFNRYWSQAHHEYNTHWKVPLAWYRGFEELRTGAYHDNPGFDPSHVPDTKERLSYDLHPDTAFYADR